MLERCQAKVGGELVGVGGKAEHDSDSRAGVRLISILPTRLVVILYWCFIHLDPMVFIQPFILSS